MISRRRRNAGGGLWQEPGNYNSHLSALTWMAQLVIFDTACSETKGNDDDRVPAILTDLCKDYFNQASETPFGHILQWRLYIFKVAKAAVATHQARWSVDKLTVTYRGTELEMEHVERLVAAEFRLAHSLLYEELTFRCRDLVPMRSFRLKDDLDVEDIGASWLRNKGNAEFVRGADTALLTRIQRSPELRGMFVTEGKGAAGGMMLSAKAIAVYESYVQEFLGHMLVLCHITAGQPLREPEILSTTWCNTARKRHIYIWERLVMIYTQYHKGQQQSGVYKDNVRFLPQAVGDLMLDYIAYVIPLRQIFLRQQRPKALISPHLWARVDSVWPDGAVTRCLRRACARAEIPLLHTSNWRQISVSICKVKFIGRDRANFDLNGAEASVVDEDPELVAMAEQSNHTIRTFNQMYAGSNTLTMDALLDRAYKASTSWHGLFHFDRLLDTTKRPRGASDVESLQVASAIKRGQARRRKAYTEADLLTIARELVSAPGLQFREGQRRGLEALIVRPKEQVVLVLGTGSGKTLVFLVGAVLADAQTTILVIPSVALRGDIIRRCQKVGLQPLIWATGSRRKAPLVIVSAEAACTEAFLEYANMLQSRQELDRIVVDEAHLTVTASDYRQSMKDLGWYVRQIRTQTVWLTATLLPAMEEEFVMQNKLVRPTIIRESTNRPNIGYSVQRLSGDIYNKVATYATKAWVADQPADKMIVYCQTKAGAHEMKDLIDCPVYTSDIGSDEDKAAVIESWLSNQSKPVIAATAALGVGFDYPHVRLVIHVGEPDRISDFAQESGRAGRDGREARSVVIIPSAWTPDGDAANLPADRQGMQLFLLNKYCSRGVLSQYLDERPQWRWCMDGEEVPCAVCRQGHAQPRPGALEFQLPASPLQQQQGSTGLQEVLRQDHLKDEALDRYRQDMEVMTGFCLYCRTMQRPFSHEAASCPRRHDWIRARDEARKSKKRWIAPYLVCYFCYQPQGVCNRADPEHEEDTCRFPDMVMPLCYGAIVRPGAKEWFRKHFQRGFDTRAQYMVWLGEAASLEGNACIQANCVAWKLMAEF